MNIAHTQYVEDKFNGYQNRHQMFLSWVFARKRFFAFLTTILQSGLVPAVSSAIILASVVGYVAAINYSMVRGASLKQEQKAIKLVEAAVLQKETILANARTIVSLEKQKEIALMENVGEVHYILQNASVAEASRDQIIR